VQRFILPALRAALAAIGAPDTNPLTLDEPRHPGHGDLASGVALELAAVLHAPPIEIARRIVETLQVDRHYVASMEAAAPGFINFRLTPNALHLLLEEAEMAVSENVRIPAASGAHSLVRSQAQPPATLHEGRVTVLADAIASILHRAGSDVVRDGISQHGAIFIEQDDTRGTLSERIIQPGAVRVAAPKGTATIETFGQLAEEFDAGIIRFLLLRPARMPITIAPSAAHRHSRSNPYWNVQYAGARIAAIERHAAGEGIDCDPEAPFTPMVSPDELELIRTIIRLPDTIRRAARECEPYIICESLGVLADTIHRLLDTSLVVAAPPDERTARMRLLAIARRTLRTQLEMLGIAAVESV
jgi:arginyl-tRNA synthetase